MTQFQPYGNILGGVYLVGADSSNEQVAVPVTSDGELKTLNRDYLIGVAEGDVAGHRSWSKTGFLSGTSANALTDVWSRGGVYAFPSTAGCQMSVACSSSVDSSGAAGVRQVRISYLDTAYAEKTEIVTLAGTTTVNTVATDIMRVNAFRSYATGTSGYASGNIFLSIATGSTVYGRISPGYNRARTCVYTVPAGKTVYVTSVVWSTVSGLKQAKVRFINRATFDDVSGQNLTPGIFFMPYNEVVLQDTAIVRYFEIPTKLPEMVDLKVSALSDQDDTELCVVLRGFIE